MILDVLDLILVEPVGYFLAAAILVIVAWTFYNLWMSTGQSNVTFLALSIGSFLLVLLMSILGAWHSLEYLDLPFRSRKKNKKTGLARCRICYQYKPLERGNVCKECLPNVKDNL